MGTRNSEYSHSAFAVPRSDFVGGGKGIRTPDIQLAKLALYQLSYTPSRGDFFFTKTGGTKAKLYAAKSLIPHGRPISK